MKAVVLGLAFCISFVNAAACDANTCTRECNVKKCDPFDCGQAKMCTQICVGRTCADMTCSKDECTQWSLNGQTKMLCTGPTCKQTCQGDNCDMECASNVENCEQVCSVNSTCKLTCNEETTNCKKSCESATCTGFPQKPVTGASCDVVTKNCNKTCTGSCRGRTLKCGEGLFKNCRLSCEDGCKMVCDETVENCYQTCIGTAPCTSVCDAANCKLGGNVVSSGIVSRLNYAAFGLVPYVMTLNLVDL